jgi:uncharacterized protein YfiM (DUF2279 family)
MSYYQPDFRGISERNFGMRVWIWRWGPALVVMALIFIASGTPSSELPQFGGWDVFAKKGGHILGYALLAAAYCHAMNNSRGITKFQVITAVGLAILYAISDEFHQSFTPGRTASARDIGIDAAGVSIGLALWHLIGTRLSNKSIQIIKR